MLALAGTDVSAYGMCVHTLGMCAGIGRDRCVQSVCTHLGVYAVVGMDRCERVQSVCAHLGVCAVVGMNRRERVQSVCAHLGVCAYVVL